MNRRGFFRLVAGSAAWLATQHVAWAFPEHRLTFHGCAILTNIDIPPQTIYFLGPQWIWWNDGDGWKPLT